MLRWRNGKRCGLKIRWEISLVGSIPTRSILSWELQYPGAFSAESIWRHAPSRRCRILA
jgi:hypothetical protein